MLLLLQSPPLPVHTHPGIHLLKPFPRYVSLLMDFIEMLFFLNQV